MNGKRFCSRISCGIIKVGRYGGEARQTARPDGWDKKALWIWEGYLLLAALLPAAGSVVLACLPIPAWISWAFTGLWGALWLFFAVFFLPVMHKRFSYRMTGDRLEVHTGVIYTHHKAMPVSSVKYLSTFDGSV